MLARQRACQGQAGAAVGAVPRLDAGQIRQETEERSQARLGVLRLIGNDSALSATTAPDRSRFRPARWTVSQAARASRASKGNRPKGSRIMISGTVVPAQRNAAAEVPEMTPALRMG